MSIHPEQHPLDGKLEPETKDCFNDRAPLYSIAISLKRIADAPREAAARITELEGDLKAAFREISKLAREAGEAKGRLEMSEAAGIVDGWRERAERAEARCRALESASPAEPSGWRPTHRHVKRGTDYQVIGEGWLQTAGIIGTMADDENVTIYRGEDGRLWVRPTAEFTDGRFTSLPPTSEGGGA